MEDVKVTPWVRRWLWFAGLYIATIVAVAAVAFGLRAVLKLFV